MRFIDRNSDLNTVNFLAKSLPFDIVKSALDRSGLVQKEIEYTNAQGTEVHRKQWVREEDEETQEKIPTTEKTKHLVDWDSKKEYPEHIKKWFKIPPNWTNVKISTDPKADLQVMGKDSKNRTQCLYNPDYMKRKSEEKFARVRELAKQRDKLIEHIANITKIDTDTGECLNLMFQMGLRPGSTRDTKAKVEAIGATTLRGEHVLVEGKNVYLDFVGKKGVHQRHLVANEELAKTLVERKAKAGDSGNLFNTTADKLRAALPKGIHPKDLRTLFATYSAREFLKQQPKAQTVKEFQKLRNATGDYVCQFLGNQRTMSLNSYIDPKVFQSHSPEVYKEWSEKNGLEKEDG